MQTDIPAAVELTATVQNEIVSRTPPQDCPITRPQDPPFAPPAPYSGLGTDGYFWYGTNDLWVSIPDHAVWSELPHDAHGYSQKIPWWRNGYEWDREPQPNLTVTGER